MKKMILELCMLLHACNVMFHGYYILIIRTGDTDVVVFAVAAMQEPGEQAKL